jgi:hypothetical protein
MVAPRIQRYFARFGFDYCGRINPEYAGDSPSGTLRRGRGRCVMLTMSGFNGLWVRILVRVISATSIQNRVPEVVLMDNHQL